MGKLIGVTSVILGLAMIGVLFRSTPVQPPATVPYAEEMKRIVGGAWRVWSGLEADRKAGAQRTRKEIDDFSKRVTASDRRRPTFRKLAALGNEIDFAAQDGVSPELVAFRLKSAGRLGTEINEILGTSLDSPD